jgi:hypothetical protein
LSSRGKVLRIDVAVPTFVSVPRGDEADTVEVKTRTTVHWPDNWHTLPPKWKAVLVRELINEVIRGALAGDREDGAAQAVLDELGPMLGWKKRGRR